MNKPVREALGDCLLEMGEKYENIIAMTADLGSATKIIKFKNKFSNRYFDVGIAENNMIGIASGLSQCGFKVFLSSFASFVASKFEVLSSTVMQMQAPIVIIGTHTGLSPGLDGPSQMGLFDVATMRVLPGMSILNPATYSETIEIVKYLCETKLDGPHYLRLGRQPVEDVLEKNEQPFIFGEAKVIQSGDYITLFSTGCILPDVIKAASIIKQKRNIFCNIVHFPTLKPIDKKTIIEFAKKSEYLYSIEDHSIVGGLGSIVSEVLTDYYPRKLVRIGLNDVFPESGPPDKLYEKYGLSAEKISDRILEDIDNE